MIKHDLICWKSILVRLCRPGSSIELQLCRGAHLTLIQYQFGSVDRFLDDRQACS